MTRRSSQSLDDIIAIYLEAVDSNRLPNVEAFIRKWPEHRADFLQFLAQNNAFGRVIGAGDQSTTAPDLLSQSRGAIESLAADFRIGQIIGRGGMGTVYEAVRLSDNKPVAVKVLHQRTSSVEWYRQRFTREFQAIQSIEHPHIVPVYSVLNSTDAQCLIMKRIDGVPLSDLVTHRVDLNPRAAKCFESAKKQDDYYSAIADLTADIASALEAAHQVNIIHRDIKPSNLMLDCEGKVWLTDFGLASMGDNQGTLTATGDILGTPIYMSPEQAMGNRREVDHRTDVYSLGATLYALTTRQRPYEGSSIQILRQVSEGVVTPPTRVRNDVPRDLEAIILKAMARRPAKRYQSAAELEHDLRRFVSGRSVRAKGPGLMDQAILWMSRHPRLTITAITSLSATILSVILVQWTVSSRLSELIEQLSNSNQKLSETNQDLVASRQTLERNIYDADMSDAYRAFAQGDNDRLRELLSGYGPDSDRAALAGFEWRLLDELSRPIQVRRIRRHAAAARDLTVLAGSTQYVTVADDGSVHHSDLVLQEPLSELEVDGKLASIAVSPDRQSFVIGQNVVDGMNPVTLRDLKTGRVMQQLTGHEYAVESAVFSPSGRLVATAGRYHDVLIHSVDGSLRHRLRTSSRNESLAFSPDEKYLLTVFRANDPFKTQCVRVWDLSSLQPAFDLSAGFSPTTFALSASGTELILADMDQVARMTFPDGAIVATHTSLRGRVRSVAVSSDGTQYAAGCDNGLIYLWDVSNERHGTINSRGALTDDKMVSDPMVVDTGEHGITSLAFADNGELLSTSTSGEILTCKPTGRNPRVRYPIEVVALVCSNSDPDQCFVRCVDGTVMRFNILADESLTDSTSQSVILENAALDNERTLAVSPCGTYLAAGTPVDLIVAEKDQGDIVARLDYPDPEKVPRDLGFTRCGQFLLALFNDRLLRYRKSDWTLSGELDLPNENAKRIGLTPDGTTMLVLSERDLLMFSVQDLTLQKSFSTESEHFTSLAVARSGPKAAIGCVDGTTRIVDTNTLEVIAVFHGHRARIHSMQFYDQDRSLMTCDTQAELRLWDLTAHREKALLYTGSAQCALMEESDTLLTWGSGWPLRVWTTGRTGK